MIKNYGGEVKKGGCDICGNNGPCYVRDQRGQWRKVFICKECAKKGEGKKL